MSNRAFKRPRTVTVASKRPIDKQLINVAKTVGTSQLNTVLTTATFPCTVTGIRWDLSALSANINAATSSWWAIVLVKDGNSANNIATSDGSSFYQPEQNVLAFGVANFPDADAGVGSIVKNFEGSTKTMRKLMAGDELQVIMVSNGASVIVQGIVQFFCKS